MEDRQPDDDDDDDGDVEREEATRRSLGWGADAKATRPFGGRPPSPTLIEEEDDTMGGNNLTSGLCEVIDEEEQKKMKQQSSRARGTVRAREVGGRVGSGESMESMMRRVMREENTAMERKESAGGEYGESGGVCLGP